MSISFAIFNQSSGIRAAINETNANVLTNKTRTGFDIWQGLFGKFLALNGTEMVNFPKEDLPQIDIPSNLCGIYEIGPAKPSAAMIVMQNKIYYMENYYSGVEGPLTGSVTLIPLGIMNQTRIKTQILAAAPVKQRNYSRDFGFDYSEFGFILTIENPIFGAPRLSYAKIFGGIAPPVGTNYVEFWSNSLNGFQHTVLLAINNLLSSYPPALQDPVIAYLSAQNLPWTPGTANPLTIEQGRALGIQLSESLGLFVLPDLAQVTANKSFGEWNGPVPEQFQSGILPTGFPILPSLQQPN